MNSTRHYISILLFTTILLFSCDPTYHVIKHLSRCDTKYRVALQALAINKCDGLINLGMGENEAIDSTNRFIGGIQIRLSISEFGRPVTTPQCLPK